MGRSLAVIVLAGGRSRRMDQVDKLSLTLNGTTLLDRVLRAWPDESEVVAVGPQRPTEREVIWCREEPVGEGPVAAVETGLRHVSSDLVALVGGDMPLLAEAVPLLVESARTAVETGHDGAWAVTSDGRPQPLASCVLTSALRAVVPATTAGRALLPMMSSLDLCPVAELDDWVLDVDTRADFEQMRQRLDEQEGLSHD